MLPEKMEQGFNQNLEAIQLLQNALGTSFLEAYVENEKTFFRARRMAQIVSTAFIEGQPDRTSAGEPSTHS